MSDSNVIMFPRPEPSTNLTCVHCGSEWWQVDGVVINAETGAVTGHTLPARCAECGEETGR